MPNTTTCPVPGCDTRHPRDMLMCKGHWFKVPKPLRDAVWSSYRHHGVLSTEYLEARTAAIESVS